MPNIVIRRTGYVFGFSIGAAVAHFAIGGHAAVTVGIVIGYAAAAITIR